MNSCHEETEISGRIRQYVAGPIVTSEARKLLLTAASEADRFYHGMTNWKEAAQAKDKSLSKLRSMKRKPMELMLCEQRHIILKPDQPYIFRVDPTCKQCLELEKEGKS